MKGPPLFLACLLALRRGRRLVVTIHNRNILNPQWRGKWWNRAGLELASRRVSHFVVVAETLRDELIRLGIQESRISVIPAYLPPSESECTADSIPEPVRAFMDSHNPLLSCQGWFSNFINGRHVYGFEDLGHALAQLRESHPRIGLLTLISGPPRSEYRQHIYSLRDRLGLSNHWMLHDADFPAPAAYARSDLFIRPTLSDGDSVSVRECLDLGTPVLATDIVARPAGCHLYTPNGPNDRVVSIRRALASRESVSDRTQSRERQLVNAELLAAVYQTLVGTH